MSTNEKQSIFNKMKNKKRFANPNVEFSYIDNILCDLDWNIFKELFG